jgi:hypothetical protein
VLAREFYVEAAREAVHTTLFDLKYAELTGGSLFSTARQPLRALQAFDSQAPALGKVAAWESVRSVQLPWVNELSVRQVVQLREEASKALPAFRETFVADIATADSKTADVAERIQRLREDASAIGRELTAATTKSERLFRGAYGILGMSAAIYGAATGEAAAGVVGLLSVLGLLHQIGDGPHREKILATSSPAYVLLKAKQLAQHAPDHKGDS